MRKLFQAFYPLSEEDRDEAWLKGLVIVDTSALLNLYRYPLAARERLLTVLGGLKDRLWLPHQAALEYHRNYRTVRLDQVTRFGKVRDEVGALKVEFRNRIDKLQLGKRHALINAEPFVARVVGAVDEFQKELNEVEMTQSELYQEGSLQRAIEELFAGRIGPAPTQESLDLIYKEGNKRFENKVPPGYEDSQKGTSKDVGVFMFSGMMFQRKFGDLIVWKEILKKTSLDKLEWFIFVTDDSKEDWWQIVGGQRIGPRTELLDEAMREGGVKGFIIHTSESFAEHAAKVLGIEVSDEVIQQISIARKPDIVIEGGPGFLEKMADAEDGLGELAKVAEGLTLEIHGIQGVMENSTKKLKASGDSRMKARITNDTASQINPLAARFEDRVDAFEVSLNKIEPGVNYIMDQVDRIVAEGGAVPEIRETLKSLFGAIIGTVQGAEGFDEVLAGIPDATAALRNAIRSLRDGVQRYIRVANRMQIWLNHWS